MFLSVVNRSTHIIFLSGQSTIFILIYLFLVPKYVLCILVLSTELIMRFGHRKEIRKLAFSALAPSSERIEELWIVCGIHTESWSYAIS